jgi:hypothetical protein
MLRTIVISFIEHVDVYGLLFVCQNVIPFLLKLLVCIEQQALQNFELVSIAQQLFHDFLLQRTKSNGE